jgi:cytoskeletal protein CcmA (bactofilin family)
VINGTITGDVTVEHFVELQSNAHVNGNIYYQQLRMDVGASVEGKLTKRENMQVAPATPRLSNEVSNDVSNEVSNDVSNDASNELSSDYTHN